MLFRKISSILIGLVLLALHAKADEGERVVEGLGWIPKGALEIPCEDVFPIVGGLEAHRIELGDLRTNSTYYVMVPFRNMFESDLEVESIKSSCGCMSGYLRDERIPPDSKSYFVVLIHPQKRPGPLAKRITLKTSKGSFGFLATGEVVEEFLLAPKRLQLSNNNAVRELFSVKRRDGKPIGDVQIRSLTGFLDIGDQKISESSIACMGSLDEDSRKSIHVLIERIAIVDAKSGELLCEQSIAIDASSRIACRPSQISLTANNAGFSGSGLLFGSKERLDQVSDSLEIRVYSGGHVRTIGKAVVGERTERLVPFAVQFKPEVLDVLKLDDLEFRVLSEGEMLCRVPKIVCLEGAKE